MESYAESLKLEAVRSYKSGEPMKKISSRLGVGYSTIRQWIKRYKTQGICGLKSQYWKCGRSSRVSESIKQQAIELKKNHQDWGATFIRIKLQKKYPQTYIPSARQLQRYFVKAQVAEQKQHLPQAQGSSDWAHCPFYRVQVDAKEQLHTADGKACSYLTFTDEHSGAILDCFVFPPQVHSSGTGSGNL